MKSKIIATALLVASIILVVKSLPTLQIYNHVNKGNSFVNEEKYSESREEYEKALKIKESNLIRANILKSFYNEKNYEEVTKSTVEEGFLKGNSYVYLGDNSPEKSREFYEKALEEYKLAMKKSDDINIKKNYELTLKKLEDMNNQQNQQNNQENKENQDKENKDKQEKNNQNQNSQDSSNEKKNNQEQNNSQQDNQQNGNNSQNNEENKEKNQSSNSEENSQEKDSQNEQQDNQNNSSEEEKQSQEEKSQSEESQQNSGSNPQDMKEPTQEEIREQEVRAILKRLEGNEKQSFKNNERVMNINSNNPSNRW